MLTFRRSVPYLGAVAWLLCAYPQLALIFSSANLVAAASENVSFRYFLSLRLVEGPSQYTNPGQGPLLPLLHNLIYRIASVIDPNPAGTLIAKLNIFAYLTLVAYAIGLAIVIAIICSYRMKLTTWERVALLASPVFVQYSWYHAYLHLMLPDYLGFAMLLLLLAGASLLDSIHGTVNVARISLLIGFSAALKITLFPFALFVGIAITLRQRGIAMAALLVALSFVIYLAIVTAYYFPHIGMVGQFLTDLTKLKNSAANITHPFDSPFFDLQAPWLAANSFLSIWIAIAAITPFMLYGCVAGICRRCDIVPIAALAAVIVAFVLAALRGQTTSAVDLLGLFIPAAVITLAGQPLPLVALSATVLSIAAAWTTHNFWFVRTNGGEIENNTRWNEQAYEWNVSQGLPIVFLMPNHLYTAGTAEDLIARGLMNQFGTTSDRTVNDNPSRKRWFNNYFFIDFYTTKSKRRYEDDPPLPERYVISWIQSSSKNYTLGSSAQDAALETYLATQGYASLRDTGRCQQWVPTPQTTVFSCIATNVMPQPQP